jgi:molybdenum cofactor biosynthesis enzyme MoaA
LGRFCNYNCQYCPAEFHDNYSKPHDLKTLQQAWHNIVESTKSLNLPYKLSFTGGEVTACKSFLPFIEWLCQNYSQIEIINVTTNGSASESYYKKLCRLVTAITFSTHTEFMDEAEFFKKCQKLNLLLRRPKKSFHVNIMNEHWAQDRIDLYKIFLESNHISYTVNEIDYELKTRVNIIRKGIPNVEQLLQS